MPHPRLPYTRVPVVGGRRRKKTRRRRGGVLLVLTWKICGAGLSASPRWSKRPPPPAQRRLSSRKRRGAVVLSLTWQVAAEVIAVLTDGQRARVPALVEPERNLARAKPSTSPRWSNRLPRRARRRFQSTPRFKKGALSVVEERSIQGRPKGGYRGGRRRPQASTAPAPLVRHSAPRVAQRRSRRGLTSPGPRSTAAPLLLLPTS
jgi:hypothetical protein